MKMRSTLFSDYVRNRIRSIYALKDIKTGYALAGITALTACGGETITVNAPPPPAEYLTCASLPEVPDLSPLTPIQASNGAVVYMKQEVDARDSKIARYIVDMRGAWFDCYNQLNTVKDYVEAAQ